MDELNSNATPLPPDEDLTEVRKPTSLLIAQFFLFPLIIIGICVGIFLFFGYLTYETKSAGEYLNQIRSGNGTQRWQAALELSNIVKSAPDRAANPEFVESLAEAYRETPDEDFLVRRYIALVFGELKERSAVPLLIDGLHRDEKLKSADWNKGGLFQWLRPFRPTLEEIREDLIQNQIYTLWALGSIGDNSAVPIVLEFGKSQEASVRKVAAYVLGSFKDPRAVEDLRVLLNDSKDDVRWNAALALAQLNNGEGAELLVKLLDESYVDSIQDMSLDQKALLRASAATGLGMLKHEPAKEKIRTLSENDPALDVRNASLEALKKY